MKRGPIWAAAALLILALYSFAGNFLSPFTPGIFASCGLLFLCAAALAAGRVCLNFFGLDIDETQRTCLGLTAGLGLVTLLGIALSFCRLFYPGTVIFCLLIFLLLGIGEIPKAVESILRGLAGGFQENPLVLSFLLGIALLVFGMAWVPPHQYDSLVYHLPLAEDLLRNHGLGTRPDLIYSYFPQNGELLFAMALALKSDLLAQMICGLAFLLSLSLIFQLAKDDIPRPALWTAGLILATHTSVLLLSSTTYVEPLAMLWTSSALLTLAKAEKEPGNVSQERAWIFLSGLFSGLGLGTKYYAGITAGLIGIWLAAKAWNAPKTGRSRQMLNFLIYCGVTSLVFLPWMVRDWISVGDPLFPFFYRLFPLKTPWVDMQTAAGYFGVLTEYGHSGHFWKDVLFFPIEVFTGSLRYGKGMDVLGVLGWDLVFWALPFGIWASRRTRFLRLLASFCAAYLAAWFATGVVLRFLDALAPLLCLLGGAGLWDLWQALGADRTASRFRPLMTGAVGLAGITHLLLYFFVQIGVFDAGKVLLGAETPEQFLSRRLDYYPCARAGSEILSENDKILVAGEQRGYYLHRPSVVTTIYAPNPYLNSADEAKNPEDFAARLRGEGFSAILLVPREQRRLGSSASPKTPNGVENWNGLLSRLKPAFEGPACALLLLP